MTGPWKLVADDLRYKVMDRALDDMLTASETVLRHGQETRGHSHPHAEMLFVTNGRSHIEMGEAGGRYLYPGAVVLILPNVFHRVVANEGFDVSFMCAFAGDRAAAVYRDEG